MSKAVILVKLLLRNAYRLFKSRSGWSDILSVEQPTHNDLTWWFESLKNWNGRSIADSSCCETIQIATDASAHGWGGNVLNSNIQAQGVWTSDMVHCSSNMREISAVLLCLQSFAQTLRGKRVQILTDNVMCKFPGWNARGPVHCRYSDLEFGNQKQFNHFRQMVGGQNEHLTRLFKLFRQQTQLENSPKSVSVS